MNTLRHVNVRMVIATLWCWTGMAYARTPVPDAIFYGTIVDRLSNQVTVATAPRPVTVRVNVGGTTLTAYELGNLPEANDDYVVRIPRDDGVSPRIPNTATAGDLIHMSVNYVEVDETVSNGVSITANITDVRALTLHADADRFDHDNDGLTDVCESTYFGSEDAEPDDDPDGDGFTNVEECFVGTDPTDDTSFPEADIGVTKDVSNPTPNEGDLMVYTLLATNNGPHDASNLAIMDVLPAGVTFNFADTDDYTNDVWTIGDLPHGASTTLTLTVTVDAGTGGMTITNRATVAAVHPIDTNSSNDEAGAILTVYPEVRFSDNPACWNERGVLLTNTASQDFAAVNQGQVKYMASQAYLELEETLPGILGGAGTGVTAVVNGFSLTNGNYFSANIGQLKYLAKPFYDRLEEVGYTNGVPWSDTPGNANDFAVANIGQLKQLFSFEIDNHAVSP